MDAVPPRYAVYYAPAPGSALWRFGSGVIGYDAATGEDAPLLVPAGVSKAEWRALTAEPRRYGFHATLKAPFRLAEGATEADLHAALGRFAGSCAAVDATLEVATLGAFVALAPQGSAPDLSALADAAVD